MGMNEEKKMAIIEIISKYASKVCEIISSDYDNDTKAKLFEFNIRNMKFQINMVICQSSPPEIELADGLVCNNMVEIDEN